MVLTLHNLTNMLLHNSSITAALLQHSLTVLGIILSKINKN